jgi:hypothetical protein
MDITGRPMKGWVMVAPQGFAGEDELARWLDVARTFVEGLQIGHRIQVCSVRPALPQHFGGDAVQRKDFLHGAAFDGFGGHAEDH